MINAITLSRALNLFYSRHWSNHLVHLMYGNWLSCKRINKVSPLLPHQSAKLDCGFLLEKVCFPFSVQETVLHCVSRVTSHVPESSRGKQGAHFLLPLCRSLQRQVSGQQSRVWDENACAVLSCSVRPNSLQPYALWPNRLLCPWQEYWRGLPFDPSNPGIKPMSPALAGGFCITEPPGKPNRYILLYIKQITSMVILYSIGDYIQYLVITYNGKESDKEYIYLNIYVYIWITLLYTWN